MTTSTNAQNTTVGTWRPALDRTVAMRLAATEYQRFGAQLERLTARDWSRPTDCPAWDVKAVAGHVTGMAEMSASIREQVRQMRTAGKSDEVFIDALTALQVAKHADDSATELVRRFAEIGPKAARGRRRTPGPVRRFATMEENVAGQKERWAMGYLVDVILTRDTWMHRVDVARAVGIDMELTPDHDGVLVGDVAAEWARRHGKACSLTLTGPAGGSWSWGTGGPTIELDAVEFCRGLSGRGRPALDTEVPF
jgi:uncharacterized protein (TIGR03083 family)